MQYPFNERPAELGQSRALAEQQFRRSEARFSKNPQLKDHYVKFLGEYESMGHMQVVPNKDLTNPYFFIPHHAVGKDNKFRVVFNAYNPTDTDESLNGVHHCVRKTVRRFGGTYYEIPRASYRIEGRYCQNISASTDG